MPLWGTGDTKNLVVVITAVIWNKVSSYQLIKCCKTTLRYYGLTKQIWSVKSQFCNKFYAGKSLWSCRIYCKTFLIPNCTQETLTFLTTYLYIFVFAVSHFTATHTCVWPQCRGPPTDAKALYFSSRLNWFHSQQILGFCTLGPPEVIIFKVNILVLYTNTVIYILKRCCKVRFLRCMVFPLSDNLCLVGLNALPV